jgi:hypothetical protein
MSLSRFRVLLGFACIAVAVIVTAQSRAAIIISEVDPSGSASANNTYAADWFELTNTGSSAQDITGWKMDDNSHLFANAVSLRGVTSIAPGKSVVFLEGLADGSTDTTINNNFINFWFGGTAPAGFTIGNYGGASVGLSQTADEVNIFDSAQNLVTGVGFGATATGVSLDNTAGIGGTTAGSVPTISTNSAVGVNGAFSSANSVGANPHEIGSPGVVPEPSTLILACLGIMGLASCKMRRIAKI